MFKFSRPKGHLPWFIFECWAMSVLQVVDINLILAFHPLYLTRRNCTLRWVEYTCEVQKKYIANCVYLKKKWKKNQVWNITKCIYYSNSFKFSTCSNIKVNTFTSMTSLCLKSTIRDISKVICVLHRIIYCRQQVSKLSLFNWGIYLSIKNTTSETTFNKYVVQIHS